MSYRLTTLVSMVCFAIAAFGLYLVKYTVQDVQRDVTTLRADVAKENESIHLLNAEWAYLNRPERLQQLSAHYLGLQPLDSRQIQDIGVLPAAYDASASTDGMIHSTSALAQ